MNLTYTERQHAFRAEARAWLEANVPRAPIASFDTADGARQHRAWEARLNAAGWAMVPWPVEYGGRGANLVEWLIFEEEYYRAGAPKRINQNGIFLLGPTIMEYGTPEQKARYLPRFATGELRGGIGLTEPDAGTDLQGIRMVARRDADGYVLEGTKTWITNGVYGTCFAVLAKTDPEAEPRHKGMSMFIAEKGPGFTVGRKIRKLGYRSIDSAELVFENFRVGAEQLVGGVEGRGFQHAVGGLELGRINVAARGVGLATGAFKDALAYAQQRRTFGKPIAQHQAIQLKLADMATRVEAARLLVEQAARKYDTGERCDLEAGMAKLFASETAVENSLEAMRIFGGYSYSVDFDVERYYRDSPLMCIGEGTNEMQRIIIARQLVERNPV
jgi:alkylation response protein AidB-like acyl-CoA dehydrogenase